MRRLTECVCARVTGPFSRPPSSHPTIFGVPDTWDLRGVGVRGRYHTRDQRDRSKSTVGCYRISAGIRVQYLELQDLLLDCDIYVHQTSETDDFGCVVGAWVLALSPTFSHNLHRSIRRGARGRCPGSISSSSTHESARGKSALSA